LQQNESTQGVTGSELAAAIRPIDRRMVHSDSILNEKGIIWMGQLVSLTHCIVFELYGTNNYIHRSASLYQK
jgi:hypothetical protein